MLLDLVEHHVVRRASRKASCALVVRQVERRRGAPRRPRCARSLDVVARRSRPRAPARPARRPRSDAREPVDLGAVVVEVVLAGDLGPGQRRGSGRSRRRPRPTGCRRGGSGPVGLAETNSRLNLLAGEQVAAAVRRPRLRPPAAATAPCAPASTRMFRNPGPAISTARDARRSPEPGREQVGEVARGHAGLLGQLERDVGGVVAVLLLFGRSTTTVAGTPSGRRQGAVVDQGGQGADDGGGELVGCHRLKGIGGPLRAERQLGHHGDQLGGLERLGEVGVRAEGLAPGPVGGLGPPGDDDHRDVGGGRVGPQPLQRLEAVQPRHHHVEGDHVRSPAPPATSSALLAVGGATGPRSPPARGSPPSGRGPARSRRRRARAAAGGLVLHRATLPDLRTCPVMYARAHHEPP